MDFFSQLIQNHMLICAALSYLIAQVLKVIINLLKERTLDLSIIISSGGMPSSHSSTVAALCVSSLRQYGATSPIFAVTFVLAAIVMYDAAGVRRAAGEQAKVLNRLLADFVSGDPALAEASLEELIGHTPFQVAMGMLLGIAVAWIMPLP